MAPPQTSDIRDNLLMGALLSGRYSPADAFPLTGSIDVSDPVPNGAVPEMSPPGTGLTRREPHVHPNRLMVR